MKRNSAFSWRQALLALVSFGALVPGSFAGSQEEADKTVAAQAARQPFPFHFYLAAGYEDTFMFRGVDILPDVQLDIPKASIIAIKNLPDFSAFLQQAGVTPKQFVSAIPFPKRSKINQESGIGYFDGNVSAYGFTAGAFYALQDTPRQEPTDLGAQSPFTEYREFDAYFSYAHALGPVTLSLGGTYYHVEKNSQFDTLEMNFGVFYTPRQFKYVTASFSYDYASGFKFDPEYLDGHHLEFRIAGNIPVIKHWVEADPYMLVSAGSGIVPRAFNKLTLPTYFSTTAYAAALVPRYQQVFNSVINGNPNISQSSLESAKAAIDPTTLDRDFDLSNFEIGCKVPVFLPLHLTFTGDVHYSRPLGNLRTDVYNQKDEIWGGASLNLTF